MVQTERVAGMLQAMRPDIAMTIHVVKTAGDKDQASALSTLRNTQFFTKELDDALLAGEIDLAVHSLKDIVLELPEGITLAAVTEREDYRDAFISRSGAVFADLPEGSVVGTGSVRRRAFLGRARPDLKFAEIRGNLDTRLRKLEEGQYDAIVLAACGLMRMGWQDRITELLSEDVILPAAGQGAIAVTARPDDAGVGAALKEFNHEPTYIRVQAERVFLGSLSATCRYPLGVLAEIVNNELTIRAAAFSTDGARGIQRTAGGAPDDYFALAKSLSQWFLDNGVNDLVES